MMRWVLIVPVAFLVVACGADGAPTAPAPKSGKARSDTVLIDQRASTVEDGFNGDFLLNRP